MLKPLTTVLLVAAFCVALPASAFAGTAVKSGNTLRYTGDDDPNGGDYAYSYVDNLGNGDPADDVLVLYSPSVGFTNAGGCTLADPNNIRCPFQTTGVTRLELLGRAGSDYLEVYIDRAGFAIEMFGGAGGDTLYGGPGATTIPLVMRGEAGADFIYGGNGADTIDGGDDNDFMYGFSGGDNFIGGGGFDTVAYGDRGADDPVDVTLDGVANDGSKTGTEKDNVGVDVEDLVGSPGDDRLVGNAGANSLDGQGGIDTLDGKEGFDSYLGGADSDIILARDGRSERIDCGDGGDTQIFTDTSDTTSGCEANNASNELESDKDGDGIAIPADCDDKNPNVKPGAQDIPNNGVDDDCSGGDLTKIDADGDGISPPLDCNDANAAQSPVKPEIYGNRVDEDCNGKQDPLLSFTSRILNSFKKRNNKFTVATLSILNPASEAQVTVICSGGKKRGCPFTSFTETVPKGSRLFRLESKLRKAKLTSGARLEVRMLRKDAIGKVSQFKFSKKKDLPTETKLCMAPTDPKPRKC